MRSGGRSRAARLTVCSTVKGVEMGQTENLLCAKCGGSADGWKCAICGSVAREHDVGHLHLGCDRYCTLRCAACQQADVHCTCV
jgi:hypothetical protein